MHTTEYWDSMPSLQSLQGAFYVYTDHKIIEIEGQTKIVPGIKIGDGDAYVIDLPFATDTDSGEIEIIEQIVESLTTTVEAHIGAVDMHTSSQEKEFWNNKVTASLNPSDPTNLILSKL